MYASHFGLRHRPFPATPDAACYFPAEGHERALARLLSGLDDGEGLLVLTGPAGTGKTLLCHRLLEHLGDDSERGLVTNTHARDRGGLLQALLYELGLPYEGRAEQEMRLALTDHLLRTYAEGWRTVLVVDEAQNLDADLLEEVRLLGNLEGGGGKAVQVVLSGQPQLLETLRRPALAAVRQRVAVRATLAPLGEAESADYLRHHLRRAVEWSEAIFSEEAVEVLVRGTWGVPRLLNQSAQEALRLAAEADAEQVDAEAALEALAVLDLAASEVVWPETSRQENAETAVDAARGPTSEAEECEAEADGEAAFIAPRRTA